MKKAAVLLGLVSFTLASSALGQVPGIPSGAGLDVVGPVPAATLLIPYFVVDVNDGACAGSTGRTTLVSVNNSSPAPTIAHVTVWTDQSIPAFTFDIYLTGYDVQTINVRDIFCSGTLPSTGFAVSPQGSKSDPNVPFPNCNNTVTIGSAPVYGSGFFALAFRNHLKAWFTGNESPMTGNCASSDRGNNDATGYITIDQAQDCTELTPVDPGYFSGGVAGFDNVLWGDYFLVDEVNNFSQGFSAVSIQAANPSGPDAYLPGEHTFYGRYVAASATDQREPLPTTTAARFATGGLFTNTIFYVWREGNQSASSYNCTFPGPASWYPLEADNTSGSGAIIVFNESENCITLSPSGAPANETNAVEVGTSVASGYNTGSFSFGWVYQNLQSDSVMPIYGDVAAQQYTVYAISAAGRFSVGLDAYQLDTANNPIITNP